MKSLLTKLTIVLLLLTPAVVASAQCGTCTTDTVGCPIPSSFGTVDLQLCSNNAFTARVTDSISHSFTWVMPSSYVIRQGDPFLPGFPIPSPFTLASIVRFVSLDDVTGLPPSLTWECDSSASNCLYEPLTTPYACFTICGVPGCDEAGVYTIQAQFTTVTSTTISDPTFQQLLQSAGINTDSTVGSATLDITLTIEPSTNLVLDVSTPSSSTAIDSGQAITLDATAGFDSYSWSTGDSTSSINPEPTDTTTYVVVTTDSLGCTQTDSIEVQVRKLEPIDTSGTGISDIYANTLKIYPNPVQGSFNLELPTNEQEVVNLQIISTDGRVVFEQKNLSGPVINVEQHHLLAGVYLVRLQTRTGLFWNKIIVDQ